MPSTQPSYNRDYYLANKQKILEYSKSYRKQNKYYFKFYYLQNRDKLLDYGKNYYKHHTERCRYLNIQWKIQNIPNYRKTKKPLTFQKTNQHTIVSFD